MLQHERHEQEVGVVDTGGLPRRWITYAAGIYLLTLGVSLAIRAGIGISPQSSLTRTMTLVFPGMSQGTFNFLLELVMLALTYLVMPKAFRLRNFLSLVPALALATFLDLNLRLTQWIVPDAYAARFALLVFADALLAFGLFLMIRANLVLMPVDMFVNTVFRRKGWKWGNIKTAFDCTLLVVSAAVGLICLGAPHFVREGTVINGVLVGQYVRLCFFLFHRLRPRRERTDRG
ncbi:YitT family protein [Streptomyces sp. NPDC088745]|uniref:YczE/YyaS/YitT family protein n=1 Tax=Streptomyces sp. NPDC088745 TaxID=3365884 RepID=UPI0038302AB3